MDEKNKNELETLVEEVRSLKSNLETEKAELEERKAQVAEQERALEARNVNTPHEGDNTMEWRSIADQMIESVENKRAIVLGGTGTEKVNFVNELQKKMVAKRPLLAQARYFMGPNASTEIPLLKAGVAAPARHAENTGYPQAGDEQAALGSKAIKPVAYVSLLPVTAEALQFGYVDVEAELPYIFGEAFADAMQLGMVKGAGSGTEMKGMFNKTSVAEDNKIICEAEGLPTMKDLVDLALKLNDITDGAVMVMNPKTYANITATALDDYKIYKEELIRNKSVEGVKVILTSYAPATSAEGDIMVWGGHLSNYGIGQAADLTIEPQKKVGDPNTYFLATAWFNGEVIREDNCYALVGHAATV